MNVWADDTYSRRNTNTAKFNFAEMAGKNSAMNVFIRLIKSRGTFTKHFNNISRVSTTIQHVRLKSTAKTPTDADQDQPIKFSTSRAAGWTARQSRVGRKAEDEDPWFQTYSIVFSLAVFMIYFCILREENDIDKELGRSLYDRISGLEKKQLELSLQYNLENNLDTSAIKKRLNELEELEK